MDFPAEFEARERALLGARFDTLYAYATPEPARGVTVNTLRCPCAWFAAHADFAAAPSPFCAAAFTTGAAWRPGRHPWHHAGVLYAQEPSAAAPAALLDVRPGMRVADLCAAPGGKAGQLAAALQGQGLLLANEYDAARAEALRQNLERLGVTNAVVTNEATARLAAALPGCFDRVLVDAPCSGEGMFRKEPAAAAQHSAALVDHCAALGAAILDDAAALLAPGGILVFSTCTFAPQEDEAQVAAFLARHPEFALCDLSGCGFGQPGEANRAPQTPRAKPQRPAKPPAEWGTFAAQYFPQLSGRSAATAGEWVLLPAPGSEALPLARLRVVRGGVLAGRVVKKPFEPAHALFMAWGAQCANCERLTRDDPRTAAWLRGEEIAAATAAPGWCAVLVDGFPLGGGKVSGGRVKNHYPKALRTLR